jgi:CDP-diacylglycerol--glycerol-3-phosphate 3-phosphatidyltransferase
MELDQIDIVAHREPEDFYNELRRLIASAQHRLVLSALYLGSGHKEQSLLQEVSSALESNQKLSVLFILDHSRARRGEKSSIDLLAPLVDKFYPRLQVCFYQMPQLKSAPYSWLPFWLQEVVAVYHCKVRPVCRVDRSVSRFSTNAS